MARYLAGEMNMKEEMAFMEEIERRPELKNELEQMELSWKHINDDPSQEKADTTRAWEKLYSRLETDGLLNTGGRRVRNPWTVMRIAATILLILAIGIPSVYFGFIRQGGDGNVQQHYAEKGVSTVDLPDGSRVFLNQGAEISYPSEFEQQRSVELQGEAFFEVMSDPVNPFTVRSGKVVVSVLGTSFNVKRGNRSDKVEVFVEQGTVRVDLQGTGESVTLNAGEMVRAGDVLESSVGLTEPNYISWKTKDFKFVDEELGRVLAELEESYHVTIEAGNVSLDDLRITTTYSEQSIDAILETIGTAFGLKITKKEDHFYLNQ